MAIFRPEYCILNGCGPMVSYHQRGQGVAYGARGCCKTCYGRAYRAGDHIDLPRLVRADVDTYEDWLELKAQGYKMSRAAELMGMTFVALERAVLRQQKKIREAEEAKEEAVRQRRLAVFGELSYEAARTGLDDATNYLPVDD